MGLRDSRTPGDRVRISTSGAAHVRLGGSAGSLETRTFTINAATDCVTDASTPGVPVAAELFLANNFTAGKKRARLTWHSQRPSGATTDVPHCSVVMATINAGAGAGSDAVAIARLTLVDSTVGSSNVQDADTAQRFLSADSNVIEYNLEGTDSTVDNIYFVAQLPVGTGALPVYVTVEVW